MASSKTGNASVVRRWESQGVKGSSKTASGNGINRRIRSFTTTELRTALDAQFEAERNAPKGSSSTPSSETAQKANIVKGGFR